MPPLLATVFLTAAAPHQAEPHTCSVSPAPMVHSYVSLGVRVPFMVNTANAGCILRLVYAFYHLVKNQRRGHLSAIIAIYCVSTIFQVKQAARVKGNNGQHPTAFMTPSSTTDQPGLAVQISGPHIHL
jgi:hypothetical protein